MIPLRLLITEPDRFSHVAMSILEKFFLIDVGPLNRDMLAMSIAQYDALMIRLGHRFDSDLLSRACRLKVIGSPTTGLNHIDISAASKKGISVISLRGERAFLDEIHATAEFTWGILLCLLRNIPSAIMSVNQGCWNRDLFRGSELHGKILGIIGYGRLGSKVAAYGRAFGMRVLAFDPFSEIPNWVEQVSMDSLAQQSDVITLHATCDLTTSRMIDRLFFSKIKHGAIFINTARGELVDEFALLDTLKSGRLFGAALDVLCCENDEKNQQGSLALKEYARENDNLIITPHIGGATSDSMNKTEIFIANKMVNFFKQ